MKPRKVVTRALKAVKSRGARELSESGTVEARVLGFDDNASVVREARVRFEPRGDLLSDDEYAGLAEASLEPSAQRGMVFAATRVDVGPLRVLVWQGGESVTVSSEALINAGQLEDWSDKPRGLDFRDLEGIQAGLAEIKDAAGGWATDFRARELVTRRLDRSLDLAVEALHRRAAAMSPLESFVNFYVDGSRPEVEEKDLGILSPLPLDRAFAVATKLLRRADVALGTVVYAVPEQPIRDRVFLVTIDRHSGETLIGAAELARQVGVVGLREAQMARLPLQVEPIETHSWPKLRLGSIGLGAPGTHRNPSDLRLERLQRHCQATLEATLVRLSHPELAIGGFTTYLDADGDLVALRGLPDSSIEDWLDLRAALALQPTTNWQGSLQILAMDYWDGDGAHLQAGLVVDRTSGRPARIVHRGEWSVAA